MYIVRSLELTNWLCGQGYKILKVEDSEKNPKYKIFLLKIQNRLEIVLQNTSYKRGCSLIDQRQQKETMGIRTNRKQL